MANAVAATVDEQYGRPFVQKGADGRGGSLNHLALTPDDALVSSANPQPRIGNGPIQIGQCEVRLYREGAFRRLSLPGHRGSRPRQAIAAEANDSAVVWFETTSTDLFNRDWTIFAHDRRSGRTRQLAASAATANGLALPAPPGTGFLSLGGRSVFWTATSPAKEGDRIQVRILGAALDAPAGATPTTAAERAKLPAASGTDLYYVRSEDVSPGFPKDRYEIHRISATGADTVVASGQLKPEQQVAELSAEPGRLSWVVAGTEQPRGTLYIWREQGNAADVIELGDPGLSTEIAAGSDFVAWGNGNGNGDAGQYLYEVATGKLWRLGRSPGLSYVLASGKYLGWSALRPGASNPEHSQLLLTAWRPSAP